MKKQEEADVYQRQRWTDWTQVPKGIKDYWWYVADLRPVHPEYAALQDLPLLKCHFCNFKNIYFASIEHHMKYTHLPNHPSPPNEQQPTMSEKDQRDWLEALGKKGRRQMSQ